MKCLLVALTCVGAVAGSVQAQPAPLRLTLQDAIARGIEASERVAELLAREDAARAVEAQRTSATRPQLAAIASYTRTNHVEEFGVPNSTGGVRIIYPDIPDNLRSRLDLQWPIYTGGRLQALVRAARAEAGATAEERATAQADLRLEITRSYWAVITARASHGALEQALERTNAHLTDIGNQLKVGLVPPSDVLSVEAQQARQQMLSIEAANLLDTTSAEFRRLVGLDPDAPFELVDSLDRPSAAPVAPESFPAVVDQAKAARPERKALQFRIEAAADRVVAASAGSLPVLAAGGGYDFSRPNPRIFPIRREWNPSWDIGINVRWPLFDGGRTHAETAEAIAGRRAIEARLRDFDSAVEVEIRQRRADVTSARAAVQAAETGVKAAAEARRVLADRFAAGVATNTDVLTAQVALLQAELDRTRALANVQLASARLERALGR
jgi:outer membrane protein TolC